jgi:hypothetical protein
MAKSDILIVLTLCYNSEEYGLFIQSDDHSICIFVVGVLPPDPKALPPGGIYRAFSPFSCQDGADGGMLCPFRLVLFLSAGKIREFSRAFSPEYPNPVATPWVQVNDVRR